VSFQSPVYLLCLALVPAAGAIYVLSDKRRRARTAAFASPLLLPSVAPRGPGLRRHLPLALYGLALAAVAIALARPEATVAVPEERAAVILATDISGSMEATDVQPSRIAAVQRAARDFLGQAPEELRVGAVAFNHAVRSIEPPRANREDTRALVDGLTPSGGTATGEGLAAAVGLLAQRGAQDKRRPPAAIILLSDGTSTHGRDPIGVAREAARLKIPIYTVALGTDSGTIEVQRPDGSTVTREVPPDRVAMRRIATISGARTFSADAGDELATVYERLGSQVAMRNEKREVTAAFVGGAAAFLLVGGAMSLRWFGRLP
jgi:Ca-activated chloride channel family protein